MGKEKNRNRDIRPVREGGIAGGGRECERGEIGREIESGVEILAEQQPVGR